MVFKGGACLALILCVACGDEDAACRDARLCITEIMANPRGPDAGHEWIEIFNGGARPASLAGTSLVVISGKRHKRRSLETQAQVPVGAFWVLGGGTVCAPPLQHAYGDGFELPNRAATLQLKCGKHLLDEVAYGQGAVPAPQVGASLALAAGTWCVDAGPPYDGENVGTPGAPNAPCAP